MILSAGVIPLRETADGPRFLLLRAYQYWDFPKGEVESGEETMVAARRELAEEAGIRELELPWGSDFYETLPYGRGKVARYYLARTATAQVRLGINPQLGRPEHDEYRWVSTEQGLELLNARVAAALRWALTRIEQ
jgi:8-oxo-dGTP pyrophosphatase MutT (NUDIX family)